jgi:serine/threonine protein kinase/Flp pilus assembly protein TadD
MSEHHELAAAAQDEKWVRIDRIADRFEDAWRQGKQPALSDYLREGEDLLPGLLVELIHAELEFRLQAGEAARVEEYLTHYPELADERQAVLALLQTEWRIRARLDPQLSVEEYRQRFPALAQELTKVLCPVSLKRQPDWPATLDTHKQHANPSSPSVSPPSSVDFDLRGYELNEQLGKGGMGEVYRCCDPALGRDLAIKVVKKEYRGHEAIERRFIREARITGSLQHPSIVAIHNLGRLSDGRLHYTMRLVRGRTFADILKEEAGKPERVPSLLAIFQKVCEAAAYAHSKRVIHRDLKPVNIMVGKFGEVQVMDWGLAKLLTPEGEPAEQEPRLEAGGTLIHTDAADTPSDLTQTGTAIGTPAYMSPEHAQGDWELVDERADVFSLGAILCEMLTGAPPYSDENGYEILRRAKRGDLAEALGRLEQCGADAALTELCRECLSPKREDRPRDADAVAERVKSYQAEVQERLRRAELERVAAETRAREEQARALVEQERTREALARVAAETERAREAQARAKAERRAKRRTLALVLTVMVLLVGGGGAFWWKHVKQEQVNHETLAALERGRERLDEGWQKNDVPKLTEALAEAERAADIARNGGASDAVEQQVVAFQKEAQERLERAKKNDALLRALLDIATPHETKMYRESGSGQTVMVLAEPSVEDQYAAAFRRRWPDVDVDKQPASDVAARLQEEPEAVVQGVIAGLDAWMVVRRQQNRPEAEWRRLHELVEQLDSSEPRRQLRALLIGATPPRAEDVAGLLAGRPPWPALWQLARGNDWRRLRQLRGQMNTADEPVLTVLLLAQSCSAVGDTVGAVEVLGLALARRPDEVSLLDTLGKVLERQERLAEAIGCYRAARARNPGLGVSLGQALGKAGQWGEGEAILRDLARQQPNNPEIFHYLGYFLSHGQKKYVEVEAACRKAIALKPDYAEAYTNLGAALDDQGKPVEAEAACRKAIALKPDYAGAYNNLGGALNNQGKPVEAEAACRKAIALKPDLAEAYYNLGNALIMQGKPVEAEAAYRKAIALKPDYAGAYCNLGVALNNQGKPVEAEAACRKAVALKPDYAEAYCNLGVALRHQGRFTESLEAFRRGHELGSKQPGWPYPSLEWVRYAERLFELEKKLPAILKGEASSANASDAITLAWMCQQPYKKRYVASARLYGEAFSKDPKLAADLKQPHRYNAACSAALAAAGQGEDARSLPEKERTRLRRQALSWLRDDLAAYSKLAEQNKPDDSKMIQQRLSHWRRDPDLASVRDASALDRLPEDERAAWHSLWRDVEKLSKRVTNPNKDRPKPERPTPLTD